MTPTREPDISRREESKAQRRDAIFQATRDLLRGGEAVSTERIARRAGVATATVYNLIGPREQLLGALLSDLFDQLGARIRPMDGGDPFVFAEAVVTQSVLLFCEDPVVWRHVVHEISGSIAVHVFQHVSSRPVDLQVRAMREAMSQGRLLTDCDPVAAARQIFASYNGALFLWAGGFIDNDEFMRQARYGLWTVIAALGAPPERGRALQTLQTLGGPAGA